MIINSKLNDTNDLGSDFDPKICSKWSLWERCWGETYGGYEKDKEQKKKWKRGARERECMPKLEKCKEQAWWRGREGAHGWVEWVCHRRSGVVAALYWCCYKRGPRSSGEREARIEVRSQRQPETHTPLILSLSLSSTKTLRLFSLSKERNKPIRHSCVESTERGTASRRRSEKAERERDARAVVGSIDRSLAMAPKAGKGRGNRARGDKKKKEEKGTHTLTPRD